MIETNFKNTSSHFWKKKTATTKGAKSRVPKLQFTKVATDVKSRVPYIHGILDGGGGEQGGSGITRK